MWVDPDIMLALAPWMAGEAFTAADISVVYALNLATRGARIPLDAALTAYMAGATSGIYRRLKLSVFASRIHLICWLHTVLNRDSSQHHWVSDSI